MNHVGYGSSIFLPAFNPFADPSYFHNCDGEPGWDHSKNSERCHALTTQQWADRLLAMQISTALCRSKQLFAGCDENCNIPVNNTFEQGWHCQLESLPDLNQSLPFVRQQFSAFVSQVLDQYT
jgi:hypothetical protein